MKKARPGFKTDAGQIILLASYHKGHTLQQALEFMGLIPLWLVGKEPEESMLECCMRNYGFGWYPVNGHAVRPGYTLHYPEDPELRPISALVINNEVLMAYEHAIFLFQTGEETPVIVRMD